MSFTLIGSTLTQTGTDNGSSASLTGVIPASQFSTVAGRTRIDLTPYDVVVDGDWTLINGEEIIIGTDSANVVPRIDVNGALIVDGKNECVLFEQGAGKGSDVSTGDLGGASAFLRVNSGARFEFISGRIDIWGGVLFHSASIIRIGGGKQKPVLSMERAGGANTPDQVVYSYASDLEVDGLIFIGSRSRSGQGAAWYQASPPTQFKGYEPCGLYSNVMSDIAVAAGTYIFEDFDNTDSNYDIGTDGAGAGTVDLLNSTRGTDFNILIGNNNLDPRALQSLCVNVCVDPGASALLATGLPLTIP